MHQTRLKHRAIRTFGVGAIEQANGFGGRLFLLVNDPSFAFGSTRLVKLCVQKERNQSGTILANCKGRSVSSKGGQSDLQPKT
jgi:hypothetical protein